MIGENVVANQRIWQSMTIWRDVVNVLNLVDTNRELVSCNSYSSSLTESIVCVNSYVLLPIVAHMISVNSTLHSKTET